MCCLFAQSRFIASLLPAVAWWIGAGLFLGWIDALSAAGAPVPAVSADGADALPNLAFFQAGDRIGVLNRAGGVVHLSDGPSPAERLQVRSGGRPEALSGVLAIAFGGERFAAVFADRVVRFADGEDEPQTLARGDFSEFAHLALAPEFAALSTGGNGFRVIGLDTGRGYRGTLPEGARVRGVLASDTHFYFYGEYRNEETVRPAVWRLPADLSLRTQVPMQFPMEIDGAFHAGVVRADGSVVVAGDHGLLARWQHDNWGWTYGQLNGSPDLRLVAEDAGILVAGDATGRLVGEVGGAGWLAVRPSPPGVWRALLRARSGSYLIDHEGGRQPFASDALRSGEPLVERSIGPDGFVGGAAVASVAQLRAATPALLTRDERFFDMLVELELAIPAPRTTEDLFQRAQPVLFNIKLAFRREMDFPSYRRFVQPAIDRILAYGSGGAYHFVGSTLFSEEDLAAWITTMPPQQQTEIRSFAQRMVSRSPPLAQVPAPEKAAEYDLRTVIRAAVYGDVGARVDLAYIHWNGIGTPIDHPAGHYWLTLAGGGSRRLYLAGERTPERYREYVQSMADLGSVLFAVENDGQSPPDADPDRRDTPESAAASEIFRANRGHLDAINSVLERFAEGRVDLPNWRELLVKLHRNRPEVAEARYFDILLAGIPGPVDYRLLRTTLEHYEREGEISESQRALLSDMLRAGIGGPINTERAETLREGLPPSLAPFSILGPQVGPPTADLADLRRRAEAGDPAALHDSAAAYESGHGVYRNARKALWFTNRADRGFD